MTRAAARIAVTRGAAFGCRLVLGVWLLAVLTAGIDMAMVWFGQLQGAGQPGDIYVAIWRRIALLAVVGLLPPLLAWIVWRTLALLARKAFALSGES